MNFDVGYIINYILNYETGIPLVIFAGIIGIVCSIVLILYYTRINNRVFVRKASVYMFIGYVGLVLWNAIKIGFGISLFIEVTQLISRRGICNIDDVIHNTLGCAIGFGGFVLCYKMARRIA